MLIPCLLLLLSQVTGDANPAARIDATIERGVSEGVFPGAVVVVGTREQILHAKGYGHLTWNPQSAVPHPDSTLYDLASLTKVVATTAAIMLLVDQGAIALDDPVARYLPAFAGGAKDRVTVRHLLEHRSGLRAFLPLHELTRTAAEARERVLAEDVRWDPGGRVVYSDLNAMLLGWIVERAAGVPLDSFVEQRIFRRLGLEQTRFRPPRTLEPRIAPVGSWRGTPVAGTVHDQNAARLGGVAGHAGLFSTGADLARVAQWWLRGGEWAGQRLVRQETVTLFLAPAAPGRALGWELNDTTNADNGGRRLSPSAVGHGGFTGTSIWLDPERDVFVVLLTNRVFGPRTRNSIARLKAIRGRVADASVDLRQAARWDAERR